MKDKKTTEDQALEAKAQELETAEVQEPEARFTKTALRQSRRYAPYIDLVNALFEDGKTYTLKEVDERIRKFSGEEVR